MDSIADTLTDMPPETTPQLCVCDPPSDAPCHTDPLDTLPDPLIAHVEQLSVSIRALWTNADLLESDSCELETLLMHLGERVGALETRVRARRRRDLLERWFVGLGRLSRRDRLIVGFLAIGMWAGVTGAVIVYVLHHPLWSGPLMLMVR